MSRHKEFRMFPKIHFENFFTFYYYNNKKMSSKLIQTVWYDLMVREIGRSYNLNIVQNDLTTRKID